MIRIRPILIVFSFWIQLACTFGSIGDSNEENLAIIQNLLYFRNNTVTNLRTDIQYFDNQEDEILNQFSFVSNSVTYQLTLEKDSYVDWESGNYRINPQDKVLGYFSISNGARTHTPFTVPLDLPTTDLYGKSYSFLIPSKEFFLNRPMGTNDTGSVYTSSISKQILDAPLGVMANAVLTYEDIYLNARITRKGSPDVTKTMKVLLGQGSIVLRPKCKISIFQGKVNPVVIGFVHSNLFRDYFENGANVSFLQTLFTKVDSEVNITNITNTDLSNILKKNLNTEDLVIQFPGCLPGVTK
ncbi:hypothetical protein LPTSP4_32110 [Leptospira ryugenii]|uniref:Uncharacterized protein n=1 Tax=Leptospira ryugenii TaxID=1917863 RepID=A0A2P2E475_9LEPT|nr:hypothetical protein [Leptospira ryugenii]GBF51673.1 hypothetical protein LPTSP4_32110 [Leptospira ryugenii]